MRKIVLGLLVLVVVASGCSSTAPESNTGNQDQSPTDTGSSDGSGGGATTVTYTDQGFRPSQATINEGETVRWVDEASGGMWVASDEHPTHTNYAGTSLREHCNGGGNNAFDQCGRGNTYTFTFNQVGTWSYHNHVAPGDGGTVVVE